MKIVIDGDFLLYSSLSQVNFEIGKRLLKRGYDVYFHSDTLKDERQNEESEALKKRRITYINDADILITHKFPPTFHHSAKHTITMVPWEYQTLFEFWKSNIKESRITEFWTYSNFIKNVIKKESPTSNTHVIPMGFEPSVFSPEGDQYLIQTNKKTKFLFLGGTIKRKGYDVLLDAFTETFTKDDDVCLIIKDFYYGDKAEIIKSYQNIPNGPEILYMYENLNNKQVGDLFRSVDCFVHPFRAEGFGMPILEAAATGLPIIATNYGPISDFLDQNMYLPIDYELTEIKDTIFNVYTSENLTWAEPNKEQLKEHLRFVYENPESLKDKRERATQHAHQCFTWEDTVDKIEKRLQSLVEPTELTHKKTFIMAENEHITGENEFVVDRLRKEESDASYRLRVNYPNLPFHQIVRYEKRIFDSNDTCEKNVDIDVYSSERILKNAQDLAKELVNSGTNKKNVLLDLVALSIFQYDFKRATKLLERIKHLETHQEQYIFYYNGVMYQYAGRQQNAVENFRQYCQLAFSDGSLFRNNYAFRFVTSYDFYKNDLDRYAHYLYMWHEASPTIFEPIEHLIRLRDEKQIPILHNKITVSPFWSNKQKRSL